MRTGERSADRKIMHAFLEDQSGTALKNNCYEILISASQENIVLNMLVYLLCYNILCVYMLVYLLCYNILCVYLYRDI